MTFLIMPTQFGVGFQVPEITVSAVNRGGLKVLGGVVQFDFGNGDASVTDNNMDGGEDSGFGSVRFATVASATSTRKIYGIVRGGNQVNSSGQFLDDSEIQVTMFGVVPALVFDVAGAFSKDDDLIVVASGSPGSTIALVATDLTLGSPGPIAATEYPIVGKCLETVADADPAILAKVWFWGGLPFGVMTR